ncbi:TetR/AcrR family transcriptional regulator [Acidisphaera sp. L21]|uniref:TetR/AcrR family transcriptional regulator n=1 Tax=Acidisphaera sp. L21 TaxID=1641851 RepID=UPI001C2022BF|nr:TetR/AcrR family transcriptional regulator [Acidisphaera sp. L21]
MTQTLPTAPTLRADARRNRDRLVAVATRMFTDRGVTVPLEDIAREAAVGIGTLYRHFPTRDALIGVVYRNETEALNAVADELSNTLPSDEALAQWLHRSLDYLATKRGLGAGLMTLLQDNPELQAVAKGGFPRMLDRMVEAAKRDGTIRADVDASDVMHALGGIYSAPASPDWQARSGRVLHILMDGLRRR